MPTGINTPLGYSAGNVAGYLPRVEIYDHSLFYEDPLTSYPFTYGDPLILANQGLYTAFGKKRTTRKKTTKKKTTKKKTTKKKTTKTTKSTKTTKKTTATRVRRSVGGSKRVSVTRKSPEVSATTKPVGTKLRGNDGNMWVVKKASNGVKRWTKLSN